MGDRNAYERFLTDKRDNFTQLIAINVSLLLGLALALLCGLLFQGPEKPTASVLSRASATVLVSVWITMEYFFYNTINRRNQEWIDGAVVYLLGMGQVACAAFVFQKENWTLAALVMAAFGIVAYILQFRHPEGIVSPTLKGAVFGGIKRAICYCGGGILILLLSHFDAFGFVGWTYVLVLYYTGVAVLLQRHSTSLIRMAEEATRKESEIAEAVTIKKQLDEQAARDQALIASLRSVIAEEIRAQLGNSRAA